MKVAFVGLGSMGAPLGRLIARAGHELAVYDPHAPALEAFAGSARLATSPADAALGVEAACVCVRDDDQVRDVVLGPGGLAEGLAGGALVLVQSTISIPLLNTLQAPLAGHGVALVDAPVTRTRRTDDEPFVFTLLGGEAADVERAQRVTDCFSTGSEHMGPLGAGMAAKIANNLVTWVQIVVGTQAATLAAHHGVALGTLRAVMRSNGALTPAMDQMLQGKSLGAADPARDAFLASQAGIGAKDLSLAIAAGKEAGMDTGLAVEARRAVGPAMTAPLIRTS